MVDALVTCSITTPAGLLWLDGPLAVGYELHSEAASSRAQQQQTVDAPGTWVSGDVTLRSRRGNVTETLAVWVSGDSAYGCQVRMEALKTALNRNRYTIAFRYDDLLETWHCVRPADYTETYDQPYRVAKTGLLRATVARLPGLTIAQVP